MVIFSGAAPAVLLFLLTLQITLSFIMRKMESHSKISDNYLFRVNMVTTSRLTRTDSVDAIGIESVIAAVDDPFFDVNDFDGSDKIQQSAVTNFHQLLNAADVTEFSFLLKQMGAKRRRIQESDRPALARAVMERIDHLSDELFSDCIWSIGTLRCTVNDFSAISSSVKGKDTIQHFWDKVARVSETADRLCITRLAIGLGKMGLRWDSLPESTKVSLMKLIQNDVILGNLSNATVSLESRELATVLFTLGQLGMTTELLPEGSLSRILQEVAVIAHNFTPQGLSNALHGLARMGVLWTDLPQQAQSELPLRGAVIVAEMRRDELCSIMQSMAVMKVQWSSLPPSFRKQLLTSVEAILPNLNNRELSNVFWALGKANVNYVDDLSADFKELLMDSLVVASGDLKLFDLESVFVGLGLMQVDFELLTIEAQRYLIKCIEHHLSDMNIFCTYNVLWGLARMGVSISTLGASLSSAVLDRTISILHTFLPTQYGDVIWSLGALGFKKEDLSPVMSDRLLAVLSRVYGKLHVRAAAYTLWGLSKMGFRWENMKVRTRSLAGGREADPLSDSVNKYLRQRVASMKEHEYSVMLYSLGGLRAQLQGESELSLPSYVVDKIHHRATRVSSFLTSRSLANSLYGLGKCGVRWIDLTAETRCAWEDAMLRSPAVAPTTAIISSRNGNSHDRKGLREMRSVELAQTLYGLGQLAVPWRMLKQCTRDGLYSEVQRHDRVDSMDLHSVSSGLWGFAAMGCPLREVPSSLLDAARKRLLTVNSIRESIDCDRRILNGIQSTITSEGIQIIEVIEKDSLSVGGILNSGDRTGAASESGSISEEDYRLIKEGDGSGRQHASRRVVLTCMEESALSLTMGLEALAMLQATISQEELRAIAARLQTLAAHMGSDSIVTCTGSLCQLGALWTDLSSEIRVTWIARLKKNPGDLTAAKRQALAESLKKMGAF